jgi:tetratricopeptide (TPR) repeat protein
MGGGGMARPQMGGGGFNAGRPGMGSGFNAGRPGMGSGFNAGRPGMGSGFEAGRPGMGSGFNAGQPGLAGGGNFNGSLGAGGGMRPGMGGAGERAPWANGNANLGNRDLNNTNLGNREFNNTNLNNREFNNTNLNNRNFNNVNINNREFNNVGVRPGSDAWSRGPNAWNRPGNGWAYNQGWVHGYWAGHNTAGMWGPGYGWGGNGFGWGLGTGMALGGLASWGMGSALYDWGYMPYTNPYMMSTPVVVNASAPVYDYSQPIQSSVEAPVADAAQAPAPDDDPTAQTFAAARASFQAGDYTAALSGADATLKARPNDADIHEFRALCLFALGRYPEAAQVLYAVLSVGPGWDWTTLISLYGDPNTYTAQLRALETAAKAAPTDPSPLFVLAYQYMTQGHNDAAARQYAKIAALQPQDKLSAQLAQQLAPQQAATAPADATATAVAPSPAVPDASTPAPSAPVPASLEAITGTWTASPAPGVTITLTIGPADAFTWSVTQNGQTKSFKGQSSLLEGTLTLARADGSPLVAHLTQPDPTSLHFQVSPTDPGLSFKKSG